MSQEVTPPQRPPLFSPEDILQRAAIDKTTRLPVLFFYTSAAVWLIIASLLGLISSFKQFAPGLFDYEFLNFGRSQPAFINALIYGWAMQAGFGTIIWIMARLCRVALKNPITILVAGHFWNLGVTIGVFGILSGNGTAAKWLEFPPAVWPILLLSYLLITVWMVVMFTARRKGHVFISQWYILAACFTFPWAYFTANLVINTLKGAGVMGPATASWYAGNLTFLWMVPVGLASAYFIIPKIVGRPIYSYHLAKLAFWTLLAVGGWTGIQEHLGGPLPAWMTAVSGGAQFLMLIPVVAVGINHYRTVEGNHDLIQFSPALRFTFFGAVGYSVACGVMAILGTATIGRFGQYSIAGDGASFLAVYMFFTMMMFGAIYFIVPRVTGCEWLSGSRIRFHFWASAYGSIAVATLLVVGGLFYGSSAANWDRDFHVPVELARSFRIGTTIGWVFLLVANVSFFNHLRLMVMNKGRQNGTATRFHEAGHPEADHAELVVTHEGAEPV
ncbi:MAG: cbb3-type cytochrome c oxidase subunit I [Verrucomicrobiales bacterium]|nr:cbb3-type cytochrome c oxidase subunit I [Verrucomicrobiales bacterium]